MFYKNEIKRLLSKRIPDVLKPKLGSTLTEVLYSNPGREMETITTPSLPNGVKGVY